MHTGRHRYNRGVQNGQEKRKHRGRPPRVKQERSRSHTTDDKQEHDTNTARKGLWWAKGG